MRHSKSARLETAPTKHGGESVYLFFEFTIIGNFKHRPVWLSNGVVSVLQELDCQRIAP